MNAKVIIGAGFVIASIIIVFFAGKGIGNKEAVSQYGYHRMPDGSLMSNSGNSMTDMMHDMNASLEGKTGDEFDKAFLEEMVIHHEGAVDMAKKVLEVSKRPELIQLANDIIAAQSKEIDMMNKWKSEWFK